MNVNRTRVTDYGLIFLISVPLFWHSLDIYFVSDNIAHILKSWQNLFNFNYYYYRPLSVITLFLDQKVWGGFAPGYHLSNALIHLLNVALVYRLALLFNAKRLTALAAALLFLVHPIHSLNIFWISGRTDMVCALFFLLSLFVTIRWLRGAQKRGMWWAALLFLAALLSKEMALSAPLVLLLVLWYERRWDWRTVVTVLTPFMVLIVLVFGLRVLMGNHNVFSNEMHNTLNPLVFLKNAAVYLGLLVVPGGHEAIALFLKTHPALFMVLTVVSLAGTGFLFWKARPSRTVWFWAGFTVLTLLPVLRLVMRWYLYLPSAGFALALSFWMEEGIKNKRLARALMLVYVSVLTVFLLQQQNRWVKAGRLAKTYSGRYAHSVQARGLKRCAVLTVPAELEETPVFMFGFQEFIRFRLNHSFQFKQQPELFVLSRVSLNDAADMNRLRITTIDSLTFELSLAGTQSQFIFPGDAALVTGKRTPKSGMRIPGDVAETEIIRCNAAGQVQDIRLHLTDAGLALLPLVRE